MSQAQADAATTATTDDRDRHDAGHELPQDEHNRKLLDAVRPRGWVHPNPPKRYNLVAVGAGAAGLVSAAGSAGLGARVAIVERNMLGGDCLNVGCVPSKALISASRAAAAVRRSAAFGVRVPGPVEVDFGAVMERLRRLRAELSPNDSAERFKSLGVDVYFGAATFVDRDAVRVGDKVLRFSRAVIATGGRAWDPPIAGLEETGYLTNETVFNLTSLPRRLAVIGAGPIGCELAQAFRRLGSEVWLFEKEPRALPREDADAAQLVAESLARDGVQLVLSAGIEGASKGPAGKLLRYSKDGVEQTLEVDQVLIGVGRVPNTDGLGLEAAGVGYDRTGVLVDDRFRTSNPAIFAAGDICSPYKFTHAADATARIVIGNALFGGRGRGSALTIPWCTYTEPEIAHVGLYEAEASKKGIEVDTFTQRFAEVDRSILEGDTEGFVRVHVRRGTDRIVGATIVGRDAGEMISEVTLAITAGVGLKAISKTIHPYPTRSEALRKLADAYNRTRLTPMIRSLLKWWLSWSSEA